MLCDTIKNCKVSDILHFMQANKLASHCLLESVRRYKIDESEIKDLISHSNSSGQNGSIFFSQFSESQLQALQKSYMRRGPGHTCTYEAWNFLN